LLLVGCGAPAPAPLKVVRYGFKNFTESRLLGEMFSLLLGAAGYTTTHGPALNTSEARNGLLNNDIDIYAEYTGTALSIDLGVTDRATVSSPNNIDTVRMLDLQQNWIVWGDAAHLNNTYVILVTRSDAEQNQLTALSDLARYTVANPQVYKWIVNQEFYERVDGLFGMRGAYGMVINSADIIEIHEPASSGSVYGYYDTVKSDGNHYAVLGYATDAQLVSGDLVVLTDDKQFFPYYAPAANVRSDFLERYPDILRRVNPIASLLSESTMRGLNLQVEYGMATPTQVAHDFLAKNNLLAP
jgi:glycine betaine/choline ABC-type transport system substrate-binding protein